jgi:hypothetical protein
MVLGLGEILKFRPVQTSSNVLKLGAALRPVACLGSCRPTVAIVCNAC